MTNSNTARCIFIVMTLVLAFIVLPAYASELITHEIDSKEIAGNLVGISSVRKFQVYLPDEYDVKENELYPVLYWIPGWRNGLTGYTYPRAIDDAIADGTIPATIAVFIDVHEGIAFLNSQVFGNWENFIISELIPFIDSEYRTIPDPLARALMGHSMGGYSSLMLPVLHPDVWGSIGGNDPAYWAMSYYIGNVNSVLPTLPKTIDGWKPSLTYRQGPMWQIGAAITPNPDAPLLCDFPVNQELENIWNEYNLRYAPTLNKHIGTLKDLLSIAIVVPEGRSGTNSDSNIRLIGQFESAGIETITRLDMPGGHADGMPDRFIAIAEVILEAIVGAQAAVSPQGNLAVTWGSIKRGQ